MRLNGCCCCFTVRTGVLILGYLYLIGAVIAIVQLAWPRQEYKPHFSASTNSFIKYMEEHEGEYASREEHPAFRLATSIISILFWIILGLLLVLGTYKNKPLCLRWGFGIMIAYLVVVEVSFVVAAVIQATPVLIAVIIILISGPLMIYFAMVVRSHYLNMEESKRPIGQY